MLERIGSAANVRTFLDEVKARRTKLFGFGHRIYKNYDPRAKIVRRVAYDVFDIVGREPLIEVAIELERQALEDDYFVSRKLYPNVDYWSGLIYKAMGFPTDMFPVLFGESEISGSSRSVIIVSFPCTLIHHIYSPNSHSSCERLARALEGVARGEGCKDLAPAPDLRWTSAPILCSAVASRGARRREARCRGRNIHRKYKNGMIV